MATATKVMSVRVPLALARQLQRLALLQHRKTADYLRLKLEEIAQRESVAATGGQS